MRSVALLILTGLNSALSRGIAVKQISKRSALAQWPEMVKRSRGLPYSLHSPRQLQGPQVDFRHSRRN